VAVIAAMRMQVNVDFEAAGAFGPVVVLFG
jgi:hypothetical protein